MYSLFQSQWTTDGTGTEDTQQKSLPHFIATSGECKGEFLRFTAMSGEC